MKTIEINGQTWARDEIVERIKMLSNKYYPGYVDPNPNAAIYKFQGALQELDRSNLIEINIS